MQPSTDVGMPPSTWRALLFARTALCGVLIGSGAFSSTGAFALPAGGLAEVNAGGLAPVITSSVAGTDITLNAPRTVISWNTFNVKPDETVTYNFANRNWIVLNKIVGLQDSRIEGTIAGKVGSGFGGNVWFVSQNSIIIGRGALIDAGGLLFAIGTPNTSTFLDPTNNVFSFNGGDALPNSRLWVLSNAKVNARGGMVAFAGPTIVTRAKATVTATESSVLYGSAKTFSIRLAPGTGGDFDLVDFIVPDIDGGAQGAIAVDLAAETRANSVFVAAVSKSAIGSAVINLEGLVTTQAAKADGGDIILSGGGGIVNRAAGPSMPGAAPTDIYLNRASASRDLEIANVGKTFARPWARPAEELKDPLSLQEQATKDDLCQADADCNGFGNGAGNGGGGNGNGNGNGNGFGPAIIIDQAELVSTLFDPTATSVIAIGRDARIKATASIELGRIVATRNISVDGPDVSANSLISSGNLTVTSSKGVVELAGVGVTGEGVITGKTDVSIDAIMAPRKLTVSAGGGIILGDGTSSVAGLITLTAAQGVSLDLASAKIDTITAGTFANLKGGALDIGTVTAPRLFAQSASLKIGTANSSGDIYALATSGDAIISTANGGDDVFVIATHGTASLGSANITGVGLDAVGSGFVGNPDVAGNGRVVLVQSTDMDATLGLGVGGVTGATAVTFMAGRDAVVDVLKPTPGTFRVVAARDATLKAPTVTLDAVTSGRDLSVGSTTGDFTLLNTLTATRNISVSAAGALRVGDVKADAGSVSLTGATVQAGNVSASEDLTLKALTGGVTTTSYKAGRDLIIQGTLVSLGSTIGPVTRDLSITSLANFTSATPLVAGRNLTIDVAGKAVVGQTSAVANARIIAGDLDLTGTLTSATAQIESRSGTLRVGGATGDTAGSMTFDETDFGQLRVSGAVRIFAGSTTLPARGDLTLQNLTINPTSTPNVTFLVGSANTARVTGTVAPTVSGGILRIGDATDLNLRPTSILITGALGTATFASGTYTNVRAFDEVRLAARQDILMGSQRFITLIQGTAAGDIDLVAGKPAGVAATADEQFRIFAVAGKLEVSADNKVVQQNTALAGSLQPVGLFLTGKFNPALIIDPPKVVELNGVLAGPDGTVLGGSAVAGQITFTVVDTNGQPTAKPAGANYRVNSCDIGTNSCGIPAVSGLGGASGGASGGGGGFDSGSGSSLIGTLNAGILASRDSLPGSGGGRSGGGGPAPGSQTSEEAGAAAIATAAALTSPPVLLNVAPVDADEIVVDPVVAGTGSEEIWRRHRQKK